MNTKRQGIANNTDGSEATTTSVSKSEGIENHCDESEAITSSSIKN